MNSLVGASVPLFKEYLDAEKYKQRELRLGQVMYKFQDIKEATQRNQLDDNYQIEALYNKLKQDVEEALPEAEALKSGIRQNFIFLEKEDHLSSQYSTPVEQHR